MQGDSNKRTSEYGSIFDPPANSDELEISDEALKKILKKRGWWVGKKEFIFEVIEPFCINVGCVVYIVYFIYDAKRIDAFTKDRWLILVALLAVAIKRLVKENLMDFKWTPTPA